MLHARQDYNERIQDNKNIIPENEPVILFRAQDVFVPSLVLDYCKKLRLSENPDIKWIMELENHAMKMIEWQNKVNCKVPDKKKEEGKYFIESNILINQFIYRSHEVITLQETKHSSDIGRIKTVNFGDVVTLNTELLKETLVSINTFSCNGIFALDKNRVDLPAILTVTKIFKQ